MKSLLQTREWAALRQGLGWQAHQINDVYVLQKKLPLGKSFLYAPEVVWQAISPEGGIGNFLENVKKIGRNSHSPLGTIFFRLEILDEFNEKIVEKLKNCRFVKSFEDVQPEWRQILDISQSEEEILAQMKPKGRYNIRVAQKHGVIVKKSDPSTSLGVNEFYKLYHETAKRDRFVPRPKVYFQKLREILGSKELAELWLAKYNSRAVAAIIVTFYQETASYLYGASSNRDRHLMAPYLLHWRVIQRAKEKGCQFYDLLAVSPEDGKHKYAGITRFKEQFGGRKVRIVGSYDLIFKPFWYRLFKMAEKMRRR